MAANDALKVSVKQFRDAEVKLNAARKDLDHARRKMANSFLIASLTQPISGLSELTGIKRTTIYWLINNWSDSEDSDSKR